MKRKRISRIRTSAVLHYRDSLGSQNDKDLLPFLKSFVKKHRKALEELAKM